MYTVIIRFFRKIVIIYWFDFLNHFRNFSFFFLMMYMFCCYILLQEGVITACVSLMRKWYITCTKYM